MKRIGIIGGMSYESTLHYYDEINRKVNERAGGLTSADLVLRSVNFEEYYRLMSEGDWKRIGELLSSEAWELAYGSYCDYIAVATNTMHKVAKEIVLQVEGEGPGEPPRPDGVYPKFIHIGDCIAEKCQEVGAKRILLLGTKFTMTEKFMKKLLRGRYRIQTMGLRNYPEEVDEINRIIFEELCHGVVTLESKEFLLNFVWQFPTDDQDGRPDAVILGCTELNMILSQDDLDIPVIDSTEAHINKLADLCLSD